MNSAIGSVHVPQGPEFDETKFVDPDIVEEWRGSGTGLIVGTLSLIQFNRNVGRLVEALGAVNSKQDAILEELRQLNRNVIDVETAIDNLNPDYK